MTYISATPQTRAMEQLGKSARGHGMRLRFLPIACLICLPFLAHAPELLGIVHTNPLLFVSSLALHPDSSLLGGKPFIDGNAGQTTMALGRLVADDWLGGRLPWWNPYTGVGLPLAAEMQPAAFFLPFVLLLHFKAGVLYLKISVQILAGLGMLGFLRCLGLSLWAAGLGGILFQLNGTFAWYADAPCLPVAFLPFLLWSLDWTWHRVLQGRRGGEAWIALAIAGSLLAGFPETAFIDGLLGLCWAAMRLAGLERGRALVFARRVAAGGVTGLALSLPATLPFLLSLSTSSIGPHDYSAHAHLGRFHAATLMFPHVFGPIDGDMDLRFWNNLGGYLGTVPLLLALCAVLRGARPGARTTRLVLASWAAIMLAAIFGLPVITPLVRAVPGLGMVYLCRYGLPSVEMAACTLAALALDDFATCVTRKVWRPAFCCLGVLMAVALFCAAPKLMDDTRNIMFGSATAAASILWGVAASSCIALLLRRHATPRVRWAIGGLLAADSLALFTVATLSGLTDGRTAEAPIAFLEAHQGLSRAYATDTTLAANYGALLGLGSIAYEYTPVPDIWADYVHAHLDPDAMTVAFPGLDETAWTQALLLTDRYRDFAAIGVRYVLAPSAVNLFALTGQQGPRRVFSDGRTDIFELPGAKPYAEAVAGPCLITLAGRERMHASCQAAGRLVRRELSYPGWRAWVGGHHARIAVQEGLFQSVALPAGESDIVWRYDPPRSRAMWLGFLAGIAALGVFCLRERRGAAAA